MKVALYSICHGVHEIFGKAQKEGSLWCEIYIYIFRITLGVEEKLRLIFQMAIPRVRLLILATFTLYQMILSKIKF